MKNKSKKSSQKQKVDVYSRFAEDNIEFVSKEDEREAIFHVLNFQDNRFLNEERNYYDTSLCN